MSDARKIRVLVVDDSPFFRDMIVKGLGADPQLEVVAVAADPFEARDQILAARPDVITCDIQMPKLNGIAFVRQLLPQYFIPVVMVSSVNHAVFDAMKAGAVDFVVKPDASKPGQLDAFHRDLVVKVKIASTAKQVAFDQPRPTARLSGAPFFPDDGVVAIGASTGGTEAIFNILKRLPQTIPGVVIVQHIPPVFSHMFAERLDNQTKLSVGEARTGDRVEPGRVLIAPGNQHMVLQKEGGHYQVSCFEGDKVNGHCPSVDVLFESVAKVAGSRSIGILLTGMGYDGARGLLAMRRKGARTIGQDRSSSVVYGMPKVAYDLGAVQIQTDVMQIPDLLMDLMRRES